MLPEYFKTNQIINETRYVNECNNTFARPLSELL